MPPGLSSELLAQLGSGVRRAYPVITFNGNDVSAVVFPSLIGLTYKESYKDDTFSDTIDLELADPEGLFRLTWKLAATQPLSLSLVMENWNGPGSGKITKQCGTTFITAVVMHADKSKGTTIKLTCSSMAPDLSIRLEKKSHAWEQTTVSGIAQQIAADNGWQLKYTPSTDEKMDRVDQSDHSDAFMLKKICSEHDFSWKVVNNTLWIRSNEDVESQSPIGTIVCPSTTEIGGLNNSGIVSWEFRENTEDASYTSCVVDVKDNKTGKTVTAKAVAPSFQFSERNELILRHHADIHDSAPGPGGD